MQSDGIDMFSSPCKATEVVMKLPPSLKRRDAKRLAQENMARLLEESGNDRVLRKLVAQPIMDAPSPRISLHRSHH
ncbi:hypothetical protein [Ensifer sp. BR816]|uniref:hypothetical protein n=1 Tax=Rhizobium sp. (strain BR816) TaxID=1057002 RepID=UPI0012FA4619|nr:hypothetical protein [Ensifer sp. BR816]